MLKRRFSIVLFGLGLLFVAGSFLISERSTDAEESLQSKILIYEVKLGGGNDPKEFVTLYNQSDQSVDLTDWKLHYAKSSFNSLNCSNADWASLSVSGSASSTTLSGSLPARSLSTPIVRSLTDNSAGSLQIVDTSSFAHDLVGWGSAACFDNVASSIPESGKSIRRYLDCEASLPVDSDNNSLDFADDQIPGEQALSTPYMPGCPDNDSASGDVTPSCNPNIVISEILPNPAGSDAGNEFIELYNKSSTSLSLSGCSVQTSDNSRIYNFEGIIIKPGEYKAFYSDATDLTLPNSSGGKVWLLDDDTELIEVTYPADMDEDLSYSLFSSSWSTTYRPTPSAKNQLVSSKPCPAGQFRNIETNRCNNLVSLTAELQPCPPGKKRNPETNRCRSVLGLASVLKPCSAGQIRNPATNRCKKSDSDKGLKPCKPGQKRNPETNRCKKVLGSAGVNNIAKVQDIEAPLISGSYSWWIAGAIGTGVFGYLGWEWRRELMGFISKFIPRIG